jgi:ATP dependent DNA ligase domain
MLIDRMRKRLAADRTSFIEPCLPSPADKPPSGSNWIHEIKHDGYRLMARRDSGGIRLLTRRGHDWAARFPFVMEAVNHLKVRSGLIDGEVCAAMRMAWPSSRWRPSSLLLQAIWLTPRCWATPQGRVRATGRKAHMPKFESETSQTEPWILR